MAESPPNSGATSGCWTAAVPSDVRVSPQVSRKCASGTCQLAFVDVSSRRSLRWMLVATFASLPAKSRSAPAV